jgi:DNA uptake protein ComE-like DNA-binding protein
MKLSLKPYLVFSRSQRAGLAALFAIVIALQLIYYFGDFTPPQTNVAGQQQWLSLQAKVDSLKAAKAAERPKIYPFNPNFITDFKGYRLGMSVAEIDRLLALRKENRYVNSATEFQAVTGVSDSLLRTMSPYFKFPEWVGRKKTFPVYANRFKSEKNVKKFVVGDINLATQEQLMKIYGIGPALSERILKMKTLLGGFVSMEQMSDVWGLSPEVVMTLQERFTVSTEPGVRKIPINDASVRELSQFPYFRYPLSKDIVTYRSMNGPIKSADDLAKIRNFPVEKVKIIAVYLEF